MPDSINAFPDTNIFLHYPPLDQIDWYAQLGAKAVQLVVCLQVIDELDDKKSNSQLADRADKAIKKIREFAHSRKPLREGVTLTIYAKDLQSDGSGDRHIVRYVKQYATETNAPVIVVTEDYGMEIRCTSTGVDAHRINPALRLENPQDEQTRKYKQAIIELNALKNRLPQFRVSAVSAGQHPSASVFETVLPRPEMPLDVKRELKEQRRAHPKFSSNSANPFHAISLVSREDRQRYDQELDDYYKEYAEYVELINIEREVRGRIVLFDLWLENIGSTSSEDIHLTVEFPDERFRTVVKNEDLPTLDPPELPKYPETQLASIMRSPLASLTFNSPIAEFVPRMPMPAFEQVTCDCEGTMIQVSIGRILHNREPKHLGSFAVVFLSRETIGTFEAPYRVTAAELPAPVAGKLVFRVTEAAETSP